MKREPSSNPSQEPQPAEPTLSADHDDHSRHIVVGQQVAPLKLQISRDLRRHMTGAEKRLWQSLRDRRCAGLRFRRQQVIDGFIVDFYCHEARLVVELDGPVHQAQAEYDAERDRVLATRGLFVLRVSNDDVDRSITTVLAQIAETANRSC